MSGPGGGGRVAARAGPSEAAPALAGIARLFRRVPAGLLAAAVAATVLATAALGADPSPAPTSRASASPGPVGGAPGPTPVSRLQATTRTVATYTVDPDGRRIRVAVDVVASVAADAAGVSPPVVALAVPEEASAIAASAGGIELAVTVAAEDAAGPPDDASPAEDSSPAEATQRVEIRLPDALPAGGTTRLRLSFELRGALPRATRLTRVGRAFVDFTAIGYGDSGSVRVVFPGGYQAAAAWAPMQSGHDATGRPTLVADGIRNAGGWLARVTGTRDAALHESLLRVTVAGVERQVRVRSWPEDPAWQARVTVVLARLLPRFDRLLDWAWEGTGPLEVREVGYGSLGGYVGIYEPIGNSIDMTEDLDPLTIVHEGSHAWFNDRLFDGRWISEGLADAVSEALLADEMEIEYDGPRGISPLDSVAFALDRWGSLVTDADPGALEREAFGYDASWRVMRTLLREIGVARMGAVLRAANAREDPYGAPGTPREAGPTDWHYFYDLLVERARSQRADDLFRTWVIPGEQAQVELLDARDVARRLLATLTVRTPGHAIPAGIRRAMNRWDFAAARREIAMAKVIVEKRAANEPMRARLGLSPWPGFWPAYEAAAGLAGLRDRIEGEDFALAVLARAHVAVQAERDPLMILGLTFATAPEQGLADAVVAISTERWRDSVLSAASVMRTLAEAPTAGGVMAGTAVGALGMALGLGLAGLRHRRRRMRSPAGAGASRPGAAGHESRQDVTGPDPAQSRGHGLPALGTPGAATSPGTPSMTDAPAPRSVVSATPASPGRDVLAHTEAIGRAARVSGLRYEIALDLHAGRATYGGQARIRFADSGAGDLFLDFRGGDLTGFSVNGTPILPERPGARLLIPGTALAARNEIVVTYQNAFDTTGDGFHRFVDPADGGEYVYSNFEPFEAHRLYPCFDQPDLKGRFAFAVTAPAHWSVVSNDGAEAVTDEPDGRRTHRFATTPPISTYITAVLAGDWVGVTDTTGDVPLGAWTRRSLAPFLDPDEIFTVTRQGMSYYADLFARPYPFAKYDQIFVPEFNAGAMENAGAVTFAEAYVYRDPPTESQRLSRAETILHELAHMWFGDLATMRWWDDLWLNESFATFVSNLALAEATRFEGAWRAFHADMKRWGYQADERSTTHPIAGPVVDTDATFYNFDGITYGKGAAVLKQLVASLGRDGFRDGLRVYFDRHAWSNASLADFMAALEDGSGQPLGDWVRRWLETPSVNTLEARWTLRNGRIERMELLQDAPADHPTLRPHALEIALVRRGGDGASSNGAASIDVVAARIDAAETWVEAAAGLPAPDLVFPNHGDHGWAKVRLDRASVEALPGLLREIGDPLLRQLLWSTLWQMTRDAQLPANRYLELVRSLLPAERDAEIVLGSLDAARGALARYVPEAQRVAEARQFVADARTTLPGLPEGDLRRIWLRAALDAVAHADDARAFLGILDGSLSLPAVTIDQEMRWSVVTAASVFDLPGAAALVEAELARDATDRGERSAILARVAAPDAGVKAAAWERIHGEGYGSLHRTRAAMRGFHQASQRDLLDGYVDRFFATVSSVAGTREHEFMKGYMAALFPAYRVEPGVLERARTVAAAAAERQPTLRRQLTEAADDMERALRARSSVEAGLPA